MKHLKKLVYVLSEPRFNQKVNTQMSDLEKLISLVSKTIYKHSSTEFFPPVDWNNERHCRANPCATRLEKHFQQNKKFPGQPVQDGERQSEGNETQEYLNIFLLKNKFIIVIILNLQKIIRDFFKK